MNCDRFAHILFVENEINDTELAWIDDEETPLPLPYLCSAMLLSGHGSGALPRELPIRLHDACMNLVCPFVRDHK